MMKPGRAAVNTLMLGALFILLTGCTSTPEPKEIVLTFDGKTCQYDGPKVLTEGDVTIILNNKSEYELSLWAGRLDEGKTWQEMLDYIGPPGSHRELPEWASGSMIASKVPGNPNATVYTLPEGLYAICCCTCGEIKGPRGVWPGAALEVRAK
jgi:hypothetical protein